MIKRCKTDLLERRIDLDPRPVRLVEHQRLPDVPGEVGELGT